MNTTDVSVMFCAAPWLITALSSVVDAQEPPVPPSSSALPESCCAAGIALQKARPLRAPHSSH